MLVGRFPRSLLKTARNRRGGASCRYHRSAGRPRPAETWAYRSLKTFHAFRLVKHALKTVHASRVIDASAGRDVPGRPALRIATTSCKPGALTGEASFS